MGRMTEDGRHEGVVVHFFADGTYGSSWSVGPLADYTADHRHLNPSIPHRDEDVVSWRAICTNCSTSAYRRCWTGPVWKRVQTPAEQDIESERIYSPDSMLPPDLADLVMADWEQHIAPFAGCYEVELAVEDERQARERTADAVRDARARGASWEAIGWVAGLTAEAARKRWDH